MTWDELDWAALDRLREKFLHGGAAAGPYWEDAADLAAYDATYAARIGWKWDHVLRELRLRGWRPRSRHVFDWGCGSGIAARRVLAFFEAAQFDSLTVWDHSPLASGYAAAAAQREFPRLHVAEATPGLLAEGATSGLLVVSHVLNELAPGQLDALRAFAARAGEILWVEPGTHDVSRQLGLFREQLRAAGFRVIAPCTHEKECPMFAVGRERDWCHFFAPPPAEIFADSNWVKFGQRAGIDLRSLPYCFLALDRDQAMATPPDASRIIGRVEHFKPYARFLNCDAGGLAELEVPRRSAPVLYKELERTKAPLVYRWQSSAGKISGGEPVAVAPPPAPR
jgi:hypothetical protein